MVPNEPPNRALRSAYARAALGMQFAGGVIFFTGAGFVLDRWLGILPVLTVAGALGGATLSFLSVYRRLRAEDDARRKDREARRGSG